MTRQDIITWFLYFSGTAFGGWVVESTFRSVTERRWVNSGFLAGPFIPIYGFGALAIAGLAQLLGGLPAPLFWLIICITPTFIEYGASLLLEKAFGLRLWDYKNEPLNLRGRVCLMFSSFWAIMTVLTIVLIQPFLLGAIGNLSGEDRNFLAGALVTSFALDTIASSRAIFYFKSFVSDLRDLAARGGSFIPSFELDSRRLPREMRRLLRHLKAFPKLVLELRPSLGSVPEWIKSRLESIIGGRYFH